MASATHITALVVAAGSGSRMGGGMPKQYRLLGDRCVLAHAIDALLPHMQVQVVIGAGHEDLYAAAVGARPLPPPVIGGATRRDSVLAGLATIETPFVFIHDAARPFLPPKVIESLGAALETADGAIPVLPVVDSLATRDGAPVDRAALVRVQTPQAFRTNAIRTAHAAWDPSRDATDDAQVLRAAGGTVVQVPGDPMLEKLTYERDFERMAPAMISRTGLGFDVHAFGGAGPVWLCGVPIPHARGLAGHSDADVALHALVDALLGAAALGDIGDHFPPSDPQWKGAPSRLFVEHAVALLAARGAIIDHVDVTIICEKPKVGPHRAEMRTALSSLLRVDENRISVKATTTERLGFTGREEGIAAQAVATIRMNNQ